MLDKLRRKFIRNWRDYGVWHTLQKSCAYAVRILFERQRYRLYKIDLQKWNPPESPQAPEFEFRLITADEQDLIRQIVEIEEWLEDRLVPKLLAGGLCLVALQGEALAGFNLIAFGAVIIPRINLKRKFKPHEAWSEQISVSNNFRRMGVAQNLRLTIFQILKQRGIKRFYGGAAASNQPSLKLAEKVGFRIFAESVYCKILHHKYWIYKRLRNGVK